MGLIGQYVALAIYTRMLAEKSNLLDQRKELVFYNGNNQKLRTALNRLARRSCN